jgi:hypothetical protein
MGGGGVGVCLLGRNSCGMIVVLLWLMLWCRLLILISGSGYPTLIHVTQ